MSAQHTAPATRAAMSHGEVLESLSGLLIGLFVAILSSTVVTNALPRIVADLHGTETSYTWVVTATLLAMTATTPIWGKLADLFSKKLLVQISLVTFVAGSAVAGQAQDMTQMIAARAVQGIGAGGLTALVQVCMAAMIAPRERGRYSGYLGATFAIATIGGPLAGGLIVDTPWLGWRWCFYVGVPFALVALVVLQKTLHLPRTRSEVSIDYAGAALITAGVSALLVWVSLAGHEYAWASWQTAAFVPAGLAVLAAAALVETRAREPIIPLALFRRRTIALATAASTAIGVAMFGATVFLSQYFQLSRGRTPTESGVMTLPMIVGLVLSSTITGRRITRHGFWKRYLVAGTACVTLGFALMGTIDGSTAYPQIAVYMAVIGVGIGMTMQNLVLSVQNAVDVRDLGAASSTVAFFRSMGGALGVSLLGAVLAAHVKGDVAAALGGAGASGGDAIPDLAALPSPVRGVVEAAYGTGTAEVFLIAAPFALAALSLVLFIREVPLRSGRHDEPGLEPAVAAAAAEGVAAVPRAAGEAA